MSERSQVSKVALCVKILKWQWQNHVEDINHNVRNLTVLVLKSLTASITKVLTASVANPDNSQFWSSWCKYGWSWYSHIISRLVLDLVYFSSTPPLPRAVLSCCRITQMSGSSFPSPSFSFKCIKMGKNRSKSQPAPVSWCLRRIRQAGPIGRRSGPLPRWPASPVGHPDNYHPVGMNFWTLVRNLQGMSTPERSEIFSWWRKVWSDWNSIVKSLAFCPE